MKTTKLCLAGACALAIAMPSLAEEAPQYVSASGKKDKEAAALLARVTPELRIEGSAQLYFNRLLFYKGLKKEADLFTPQIEEIQVSTLSYGIGNFHLYNGRPQEAKGYFEKAVATNAWPALAFIVGEVDLKRLK